LKNIVKMLIIHISFLHQKNIYKNLHQVFTAESKFWYVCVFMPLVKFVYICYNAEKMTNGKGKGECLC